MKVKRYIGQTTQEAMQKIRSEMGKDAVILSTRMIRQKGVTGWFKKPLVEMVAAVDETNSSNHNVKNVIPAKVLGHLQVNDEDNTSKVLNKLENQISAIGEMLDKLSSGFKVIQSNAKVAAAPEFLPYYEMLVQNEICEDIARVIIDNAIKLYKKNTANFKECLRQTLHGYIGHSRPLEIPSGSRKVVVFVGPTGVGKTTSLAKLAAIFSIQKQKKVGLITADTYRIAAVDQLKIYAEILEIPLSIVYSPKEITSALEQHRDKDVIFVDTAGKSLKDRAQEREIMEIISLSKADEVYLVLSCNTSYSGCLNIIKSYSFLSDYKLFITKLDEASNYGMIVNCRYMTGKSLSYIATGQNVPDDIEVADPDKLLSLIMRRVEP